MDKPLTIFDVAGRAMSAQLVRMNTTASNLANAGGVAGTSADAYRSMKPVFKTSYDKATGLATVDVKQVVTTGPAPTRRHDPNHPRSDFFPGTRMRTRTATSSKQPSTRPGRWST